MKVKNVVFSGFAAAMLAGACGAADAATVNLASKSYVDDALANKANLIDLQTLETTVGQKATIESLQGVASQVNTNTTDIANLKSGKQDVLTAGNNIDITDGVISAKDVITTTAMTTIQESINKAIEDGDKVSADALALLKADVEGLKGSTATSETMAALTARVKAIEDAPYASEQYVTDAIAAVNTALASYAKTEDVNTALNLKANQTALEQAITDLTALINGKQAAGEYALDADLSALEAVVNGKADASTVTALQNTINALGETYATDAELKDQIDAVKLLIPTVPTNVSAFTNDAGYLVSSDLADYAKSADVYSKTDADTKFMIMNNAAALGANLQWTSDGKLDTKGIASEEGVAALQERVNGNAQTEGTIAYDIAAALQAAKDYADENDANTVYDDTELAGRVAAIEGAGYQDADQVEAAITTATADLATKASVTAVDTKADNNASAIAALQGKTENLKALAYKDKVAAGDIDAKAVTTTEIAGQTPAEGEMMLMSTNADGSVEWTAVKIY